MRTKKTLNQIFVSSLLVIALFLLTSCSGGGSNVPKDVNYFVGYDGLTIDLLQEESLDEVYEDSTFSYSMNIENKGAHSVVGEDQAILTIGYDPYYIELAPNVPKNEKMTVGKGSLSFKGIELIGKSKYYPTGSNLFFYFPYLKTKKIEGQRSQPDTQVFSSICYPYKTYLTELACVDFDVYGESSRTQVCRQQDLTFSDQGAPVAITLIEVENQPIGNNLVRPVYTIHFSNVGGGTVLSPVESSTELEAVCSSKDLTRADFNSIKVEAWLSNQVKLVCSPEKVRLSQEEGVARCMIEDSKLEEALELRQNYKTPLTVRLSYVYLSTLYKKIEIKRLNPYGTLVEEKTTECPSYQVKSQSGICQNRCDYCAANLGKDPACSDTGSPTAVRWNLAFSCGCKLETCNPLTTKGLCAPSAKFCGGASYCCAKECTSGQVRNELDGKCYPKCSTTCSEIKADCLCGPDGSFKLIKAGAGYCSSQKNTFENVDSCKLDVAKTQSTT